MTETHALSLAESHLQNPEQVQYAARLMEIEAAAAAEGFRFMTSVEMEFKLSNAAKINQVPPEKRQELWARLQKRGLHIAPVNGIIEAETKTTEAQEAAVEKLQHEAYDYISDLDPHSPEEAALRHKWMRNVWTLTLPELINFQLYREFSTPTLGVPAVPQGLDFAGMQEYGDRQGWLEFRFGNGTLQEGYYDNAGVFERRMTPAEPAETARRHAIITNRLAEIAAEHGFYLAEASAHLNISAYQQTENGSYESVLGSEPENRVATLDAIAGLWANIEERTWLNEQSAQDIFNLVRGKRPHAAGPTRTSVRILQNYLEFRAKGLHGGDITHGLLWLTSSVYQGEQQGWGAFAAEGHDVPTLAPAIFVERMPSFNKKTDLQIQRALENSKARDDGGFNLELHHALDRGIWVADSLIGEEGFFDKEHGMSFSRWVLRGLRTDDEGRVYCGPDTLESALDRLYDFEVPNITNWLQARKQNFAEIAAVINERVSVVRVGYQETVTGDVEYESLPPEEWAQRAAASPEMRAMYGDYLEAYINRVEAAGQHTLATQDITAETTRSVLDRLTSRT